jgi:GDPmannose 4,6-dehydratase
VEAMWLMLQQDTAEDFVIATGITTTVRDFVIMAFKEVGVELAFTGEGVEEKGIVAACTNPGYQLPLGKEVVAIDPEYFRPTEVDLLIGDASKAKAKLGWQPKYDLAGLVKEMVEEDVKLVKRSLLK